jgi:hypothetical protein
MRVPRFALLFVLVLSVVSATAHQPTPLIATVPQGASGQMPVQRDGAALAVARLSVQALSGNQGLTDAILQGSANYLAGSDEESGGFTLELKGNQESKLVLNLSGGTRQEIRQAQAGAWAGLDGQKHAIALHNCWTDASLLLPVFTLEAALSNPQTAAVYVGQETVNGSTADHLQFSQVVSGQGQKMTTEIQQLSAMEIYLDASSHLPIKVAFKTHPGDNLGLNIPVEIQFSGYQQLGGIQAPSRVQEFLQGTLTLDLTVKSIATNSGIPDSDFSTQ